MKEYAFIPEDGEIPEEIKNTPFLKSFTSAQFEELLHFSSLVEAEKGENFVEEGQLSSRLFILLSGSLEVFKGGDSMVLIDTVGEIFGEVSAIDDRARIATVQAAEPSVCLAIDQKFLRNVMPQEENPTLYMDLYESISKVLAGRLAKTTDKIIALRAEIKELKSGVVK